MSREGIEKNRRKASCVVVLGQALGLQSYSDGVNLLLDLCFDENDVFFLETMRLLGSLPNQKSKIGLALPHGRAISNYFT